MRLQVLFRQLLALVIMASVCAAAPAYAQKMVSVRNLTVNLRANPDTNSEVTWKLSRGYPLQVLDVQTDWLQVQDFEGDRGWIARHVTADTPHHIVKVKTANLRKGPGTKYALMGRVAYGEVLRTVRRQGDWVMVRHPSGRGQAWVASQLVWGW